MFKKLQKHASEVLELPPDALHDGPKLTVIGRNKMIVEYFEEVVHFSSEEVILKTPAGKLFIQGKDFVLTTVLQAEIHLEGRISRLGFEED